MSTTSRGWEGKGGAVAAALGGPGLRPGPPTSSS